MYCQKYHSIGTLQLRIVVVAQHMMTAVKKELRLL